MDTRLRALNRFGLGARIDERNRVSNPRDWLLAQTERAPLISSADRPTPSEMADALRAVRMLGQGDERERMQARQRLLRLVAAEQQAALAQRIRTEAPFAGSYERDVVRPHVFGRFEDMVLASARHPAMLFYLDNFQSIGPGSRGSRFSQRRGQQRGLNENYARELLELHTLGVDGGYTQNDVIELARMLTGWTISGFNGPAQRALGRGQASGPIDFVFAEMLHEPGTKTLLGTRYDESGVREGERAIKALCRHPSTARFVARKLATHFISDDPPPAVVDTLAKVFAQTGGDLRELSRALVSVPEAWLPDTRKFRTPQDWLTAVMRALGAREASIAMIPALRQLRHPLWSPQAPKGFSDTMQDWADPDSLLNRAELARTIARRAARGDVEPRALLEVVDVAAGDPLRGMLSDARIAREERIALAVAAPTFQWR